jgi:hypothetical protein
MRIRRINMSVVEKGRVLQSEEKEYTNESQWMVSYFNLIALLATKGYRNQSKVMEPRHDKVRTMFNSAKGRTIIVRRF